MVKKKTIPEWLPDWEDKKQYPDPGTTSSRQWAWEFLRRNPEYQQDYSFLMVVSENSTLPFLPSPYEYQMKKGASLENLPECLFR